MTDLTGYQKKKLHEARERYTELLALNQESLEFQVSHLLESVYSTESFPDAFNRKDVIKAINKSLNVYLNDNKYESSAYDLKEAINEKYKGNGDKMELLLNDIKSTSHIDLRAIYNPNKDTSNYRIEEKIAKGYPVWDGIAVVLDDMHNAKLPLSALANGAKSDADIKRELYDLLKRVTTSPTDIPEHFLYKELYELQTKEKLNNLYGPSSEFYREPENNFRIYGEKRILDEQLKASGKVNRIISLDNQLGVEPSLKEDANALLRPINEQAKIRYIEYAKMLFDDLRAGENLDVPYNKSFTVNLVDESGAKLEGAPLVKAIIGRTLERAGVDASALSDGKQNGETMNKIMDSCIDYHSKVTEPNTYTSFQSAKTLFKNRGQCL